MDVTISITPEIAPAVRRAASERGKDVASFIEELVTETFSGPGRPRTLDEILAPFRAQVEASGISDEELASFFEQVRDHRFRESQERP